MDFIIKSTKSRRLISNYFRLFCVMSFLDRIELRISCSIPILANCPINAQVRMAVGKNQAIESKKGCKKEWALKSKNQDDGAKKLIRIVRLNGRDGEKKIPNKANMDVKTKKVRVVRK